MSYDEPLVGSLAICLAGISMAIGIGPWSAPYELGSVSLVHRRYGKGAARGLWISVGIASLVSGVAILNGVRPSYALPAEDAPSASRDVGRVSN